MSDKQDPQVDRILDHDYDGIQEFDNRLPNWWLYILYGTILFGGLYWFYYQTTGVGNLPREQYKIEMAEAAEQQLARMADQPVTNESLTLMASVPSRVEAGREIFKTFCVVCHMEQGQGNVGPNLTDDYWLHGGKPMDIYQTITHGVPDKGMVAWGGQLGPSRVQDVTAFVLSIKGTHVEGKEPQGVLEDEAGEAEESAPADSISGEEAGK